MNPVLDFLTTRNGYTFEEGVAVLAQYVKDRNLVACVSVSRDRRLLESELKRLAHDSSLRTEVCKPQKECKQTTNKPQPKKEPEEKPETERVVTYADLQHYKYTRFEDMPNKLTQDLWQLNRDEYNLKREMFIKMKQCQEGDELAKLRKQVVDLGRSIKGRWKLIDEEIIRFKSQPTLAPEFNISTYRSYICKKLKAKTLTDKQLIELQHRVDALLEVGAVIDKETLAKLKSIGVSC